MGYSSKMPQSHVMGILVYSLEEFGSLHSIEDQFNFIGKGPTSKNVCLDRKAPVKRSKRVDSSGFRLPLEYTSQESQIVVQKRSVTDVILFQGNISYKHLFRYSRHMPCQ